MKLDETLTVQRPLRNFLPKSIERVHRNWIGNYKTAFTLLASAGIQWVLMKLLEMPRLGLLKEKLLNFN